VPALLPSFVPLAVVGRLSPAGVSSTATLRRLSRYEPPHDRCSIPGDLRDATPSLGRCTPRNGSTSLAPLLPASAQTSRCCWCRVTESRPQEADPIDPPVRRSGLGGAPRGRLFDDASAAGACPREQAVDPFDRVRLGSSALLAMEQGQAGHGSVIGILVRVLEPRSSTVGPPMVTPDRGMTRAHASGRYIAGGVCPIQFAIHQSLSRVAVSNAGLEETRP
jgi:hypothetical protein